MKNTRTRTIGLVMTLTGIVMLLGWNVKHQREMPVGFRSFIAKGVKVSAPAIADQTLFRASAPLPKSSIQWTGPGAIERTSKGHALTLDDQSWFEPGTARLTSVGISALSELALSLKKLPLEGRTLQIEGHTDSRPVVRHQKTYPTNWELSGARAFSVVRILEGHGFAREQLSGVGYADSRPDLSEARRRIVVTITDGQTPIEGNGGR